MSYIRSISNPEGLYVFGSAVGVEWHRLGAESFSIPYEVFEAACREYVETDEAVSHEGLAISYEKCGEHFKVVLRWDGHEVEMWETTWESIIGRYRFEEHLRLNRKMRWPRWARAGFR